MDPEERCFILEKMTNLDDRKRKLIVAQLLLDSSSDSSDDEILHMLIKEKIMLPKHKKRTSMIPSYTEEEFRLNFRMRRDTCIQLISDFEQSAFYPKNDSHGGTPKSSAENHILSFLRFAGSKTCIRDVASEFSIGESTFHRQMIRVVNFLLHIAPNVIKFPQTDEEKAALASQFERVSDLPGIIGSMDGAYIPIRAPARKNKSSYLNHQHQISITLQGIADCDGAFLDVFTGTPSKVHDAKVYYLSFIYQQLPEMCLGDLHIVADEAYPLSTWLLTPYKESNQMNQAQRLYNNKLSSARQLIDCAFKLLKRRFRQLSRLDFHQVDTASKFLIACCVLHNICIFAKDYVDDYLPSDIEEEALLYNHPCPETSDPESNNSEAHSRQLGEIKRDRIAQDLFTKLTTQQV